MHRKLLLALPIALICLLGITACDPSTFTVQTNETATPILSPTPPPAMWDAILNQSLVQAAYNGTAPADSNDVFIVIDVSFANSSTQTQVLQGPLWDLKDASGQHYTESELTNPNQSFVVDGGASIQVTSAFEVPG